MIPDELRMAGDASDEQGTADAIYAAADAWEKLQNEYNGLTDIADGLYHTVIEVVAENEKLEKRLEAAETQLEHADNRIANLTEDNAASLRRLEAAEKENHALRVMYSETTDDGDLEIDAMLKDYIAALQEES
jgi:predicted nuclease with TOPRIM domain